MPLACRHRGARKPPCAGTAAGTNSNQGEANIMNWDQSEDDWLQLKGNVDERWGSLSDCQLTDRVQAAYGLTNADDEADRQLSDWRLRLNAIAQTAR
jgi:uncharacterized protein YjbJ (UPF0337 family)